MIKAGPATTRSDTFKKSKLNSTFNDFIFLLISMITFTLICLIVLRFKKLFGLPVEYK